MSEELCYRFLLLQEKAKRLADYHTANFIWASLLDCALDVSDRKIKFLWESDQPDDVDDYYALAVISDSLRTACIPSPLLKKKYRKAFYFTAEKIDRKIHQRSWRHLQAIPSFDVLENELQEIKRELTLIFPEHQSAVEKYLDLSKMKENSSPAELWEIFKEDKEEE